ncbi:hypothetical protein FOZ62_011890, partial [Perkinsus olseni]
FMMITPDDDHHVNGTATVHDGHYNDAIGGDDDDIIISGAIYATTEFNRRENLKKKQQDQSTEDGEHDNELSGGETSGRGNVVAVWETLTTDLDKAFDLMWERVKLEEAAGKATYAYVCLVYGHRDDIIGQAIACCNSIHKT